MKGFRKITKRLFGRKSANQADFGIIDGEVTDNCGSIGEAVAFETELAEFEGKTIGNHSNSFGREAEFIEPDPPADEFREPVPPAEQINPDEWEIPEPYLIYLSATGKAKRTIQEYRWELLWWNRQTALARLTLQDMEGIIHKVHPSTARRKVAAIRSFAKWQLREGSGRLHGEVSQVILPKTPSRIPKDRGTDEFMDLSRCAVDLVRAGDRRGVWIGLMGCCGLRISEIQTAEPAPGKTIKVIGKGDKERQIPAPAWLIEALGCDTYKRCWKKGRHLIWSELKKMGIRKPHSLRHTFASELRRKGYPLEEIKVLLGHSKLDTTMIYANVALPNDITSRLGVEH
ncbi:site-specific recombinase XerD (plasmid) [Desulfocapsa sulfexigens DSM 10523]|uniref:Site-specific recombinase XerD n=1 Tax=Desulfocapsa sulfexigens (strain DSM 10523 / SB164P1) TaxID=1167006 RepID=M1PUV1_DESSD|nr:tyrosine-type recombinase/integrase [Desulfocapsa sulfexigens]AGF80106.1 site-specific recombinase XerD [Desulfocapsa sulfexigens DSM 10523]